LIIFRKNVWSMKRRKFVTQAALASGTLFMLRCKSENSRIKAESETGAQVGKFGIQLWSVRELMDEDPLGTLRKLKEIGFDDVELTGGCYNDGRFFGIEKSEFKQAVADMGLTMISSHSPGTGRLSDGDRTSMSHNWEPYCKDVAELGIETVILPYLVKEERQTLDDYKEVIELLDGCSETAQQYGLTMNYHNHDFEFMPIDDVVPYDMMLEQLNPSKVNFEMDHYWVAKAGVSSIDYFKKYPGRFHYWHVKDMDDTEEKFFTEVGTGVIDYPEIFRHAELSGLKHFLVEQDDYKTYDPLTSMEMSHDYLRELRY